MQSSAVVLLIGLTIGPLSGPGTVVAATSPSEAEAHAIAVAAPVAQPQ